MGAVSTVEHAGFWSARIDFRGETITCVHEHFWLPDAWCCGANMLDGLRDFLFRRNQI